MALEQGVYAVTVTGLAAMWLAVPGLFDGMLLRLDGRVAEAIVNSERKNRIFVLTVSFNERRG